MTAEPDLPPLPTTNKLFNGRLVPVHYAPKPDVLVPGSHQVPEGYLEADAANFAADTLDNFPKGTLYRRAQIPGEVVEGKFRPIDAQRMRLMIDSHVRLVRKVKTPKDEYQDRYHSCSRDLSDLVIAGACSHDSVPVLDTITSYPVFYRKDKGPRPITNTPLVLAAWEAILPWSLSAPGFHDGIFCSATERIKPLDDVDTIRDILADLTVDFPWATNSDRETFYGLLLTPLIRPAIDGNVPLHLITSPIERSGKTKLASDVLGGVYIGGPTPAMQLTGSEDERDKRILSALVAGDQILHLDNLPDFLDSPCLASLLTSATYQGRVLGASRVVSIHNQTVIVATGNNTRVTGEIGKRTVPIQLQPDVSNPESRTEFHHPDLRAYVRERRQITLAALIGAVRLWLRAGSPPGQLPLGGFDEWARAVGGIMGVLGCTEWMKSALSWRQQADDFTSDLEQLVTDWQGVGGQTMTGAELCALAKANGRFDWIFSRSKTEKGEQTAFAMSVMRRAKGRVVNGVKITTIGSGSHTFYGLI